MRNISGFILIIIGSLFLLDNLGVADFGDIMHHFWPLILILLGVNMLYKHKKVPFVTPQTPPVGFTPPPVGAVPPPPTGTMPPPPPPNYTGSGSYNYSATSADMINESEIFGEIHYDLVSQNFRGGRVSDVFGEIKIDLTKVAIAEGDSVLDLSTVFGSITLLIPREMAFSIQANVTFGDIRIFDQKRDGMFSKLNFKTMNFDSSTKRLHIVTSSVFGDCKVW